MVTIQSLHRGKWGEDVAVRFLRSKGHRILHRNWRKGRAEVDLITVDGDILVFVEVKTRRESDPIGGYAAAISPAKRRSLRAAVRGFTETNGDRYPHFRFDVIEILTPGALLSAERIFHFEGVPL